MSNMIKQIWLVLEMQKSSYDSWKEDDEGRLQIIKERVEELIRIKNALPNAIDALINIRSYYIENE